MINSTNEFVEITKTVTNPKMLASLDVESLFTNVPVNHTIEIILNNVYNHPNLLAPNIPSETLKKLLVICTTKTPFKSHEGKIYQQIDGVSMGSPLGPTFANFYMCHLENETFKSNPQLKPMVYCRFVDDILLIVDNFDQLLVLKRIFEENSVLKFTFEIETCKKIAFLDTLLDRSNNKLTTSVYSKPTNSGECLNYNSNCPQRYKISVIKTFLHRAYSISSTWNGFDLEIKRIKQLLINNNFPNFIVDKITQEFINTKLSQKNRNQNDSQNNNQEKIKLFYQNQMTG